MRVLITGAGGFVGGYLIRHLLSVEPDVDIIGVARPGAPHDPPADARARFVPCDIAAGDGADIARLVRDARPDRLYHLAGAASGAAVDRDRVFRVNLEGTRNVITAARDVVDPRHVLFASTGYVYGPCDAARPARESDPLPAPGQYGIYGESKQAAEEHVQACSGAVIARAFNHTGPGQTPAFSIPAFASQIVRIERGLQSELRVGNLEPMRDFLDVRDVVTAYRLLLEHGSAGKTYNVCTGRTWHMSDVLADLVSSACVVIPVVTDAARARPADIPVSVGDPGKIFGLTGWRHTIPFSQTLRETLAWWRTR